jgi:hypothetical protein
MRGKGSVNGGVEFLGSSRADSSVECSSEAFELEETADGAWVDLEELSCFLGCGLECVLHDAVSEVGGVSARHRLG